MDTTIFQNILFAALSIFLVCVTLGFLAIIVVIVFLLKSVRTLVDTVNSEFKRISGDIEMMRERLKSSGALAASVLMAGITWLKNQKKKSK